MDIGALSMVMSQGSLATQVGMAVTKMTMDNSEVMAQGMKEMMDSMAVDPNLGRVLDTRA